MTTQPSTVTGVDFVTVFVKDYDAATEFYGTLLGCPAPRSTGGSTGASSRPAA